MPDEPTEVEVKLSVADPEPIRGLIAEPDPARLAGFEAAGPIEVREVVDRYLDTQRTDGLLAGAGYRARLRTHARRTTLTLKASGVESGGVTARLELEGPATRRVDPATWPASTARDRLVALLDGLERDKVTRHEVPRDRATVEAPPRGPRLRVVAGLRQRRLVRLIQCRDTLVELSLDELEAPADRTPQSGVARRVELEAELKAGDRGQLEELAAALADVPGLGPPLGSKRDFALAASPRPRLGEAPGR